LFLSRVVFFWVTLFVSESRYLFLSHVIFLCLKAVSAPVTVRHLHPPILSVSHRQPIDPLASLPHCGSFCKLSVLIFRLHTWSSPENLQFLATFSVTYRLQRLKKYRPIHWRGRNEMISDVRNITDIFPLFCNLFSLERESVFAVTRIISLSAFLDLKKITFYRRYELRTEPSSRLSGPISAHSYGWEGEWNWKLCSGYEIQLRWTRVSHFPIFQHNCVLFCGYLRP